MQWLLAAALIIAVACADGFVGFNLGIRQQKEPLSPSQAAQLLKSNFPAVTHVKLFDYDPDHLAALEAVRIKHVVVAIPNHELAVLGDSRTKAEEVALMLAPFVSRGMQFTIAIGNEPLAAWRDGQFRLLIQPALSAMYDALDKNRLTASVKLTVPFSFDILSASYPPSAATVSAEAREVVAPIVTCLKVYQSPLFVSLHPFYAHRDDPTDVPLPYALLETNHTVGGLTYPHLLSAMVAAMRAALLKLDDTFTSAALPLVIGETGWPTKGHPAATVRNAAQFVNSAVRYSAEQPLFIFEAFDEADKAEEGDGDHLENHWGVLQESGAPKFDIPALRTPLKAPPGGRPSVPLPFSYGAKAVAVVAFISIAAAGLGLLWQTSIRGAEYIRI